MLKGINAALKSYLGDLFFLPFSSTKVVICLLWFTRPHFLVTIPLTYENPQFLNFYHPSICLPGHQSKCFNGSDFSFFLFAIWSTSYLLVTNNG